MKELTIMAVVCGVVGLGCLGGAAFALFGGEDVAVEQIFGLLVWTLFGVSLLGAAQWILRMGPLRGMGKNKDGEPHQQGTDKPNPA